MRRRKPQSYGRAVVEDVNRIAIEADCLDEGVDDLGKVLKGVVEPVAVGRVREAEARQIWSSYMIAIGQCGNEVAKHVRRRGEAVQQEEWLMQFSGPLHDRNSWRHRSGSGDRPS